LQGFKGGDFDGFFKIILSLANFQNGTRARPLAEVAEGRFFLFTFSRKKKSKEVLIFQW
jgi:hypothetical protein